MTLLNWFRTELLCALFLVTAGAADAAAPSDGECTATGKEITAQMEQTLVGTVMKFTGLPSEYKPDGNPETLEIVYLPRKKGVKSSVSDDGEVIFFAGRVKDTEQQRLMTLAFCRRAVLRRT